MRDLMVPVPPAGDLPGGQARGSRRNFNRVTGWLYMVGTLPALAWLLSDPPPRANEALIAALAVLVSALGAFLFAGWADAWRSRTLHLMIAGVTMVLGVFLYASGRPDSGFAFYFVWIAPYVAWFFPRRTAWVQAGWAAVCLTGALALQWAQLTPAERAVSMHPATVWAFTAGTTLALSMLVARIGGALRADARRVASSRDEVATRAAHEQAAGELGRAALGAREMGSLFEEAARVCGQQLDASVILFLELLPDGRSLMVRGAVGAPELAGRVALTSGLGPQADYTLASGGPVVVLDAVAESRFPVSPLLLGRGVATGVSQVIRGASGPLGVLAVFRGPGAPFDTSDAGFVELVASVIGLALERHRAEEHSRSVAGQLSHLVEASPVLIGVGRVRDATLTYISSNVERILGYLPEEVVHVNGWFLDHVHPDDQDRARSMAGDIRARRPAYTGELRFRRADGTYTWFLVSIRFSYRLGAPTTGLVYMLDVSDQVEARLARRHLESELEQARRLESLGKLAGGVAHDFNNLLAVILNYSDFVSASLPTPAPSGLEDTWTRIQHDVDEITRAAQRGRDLTRQLLTFARRDVTGSEVMNLNEALGAAEGLLQRVLGDRCEVHLSFATEVPRVRLDAGQLEQIVLNLAVNARDAMPEGGRLLVTTRRAGSQVQLEVSDTGAGMTEEVRQRAFEPFFTTKPKGEGTGLGLAIVHGIVTSVGGTVTIESAPGRGTTFRIVLPAALEEASTREPAGRRPGAGERVLLVEDEPAVREITRRLLAANGYQVEVAADPADALRLVEEPDHPLDLLLTDVVMPEMSGPELAEQARHRRPGLKLLFMSGYAHGLLPPQGVLGPGVALLDKPFTEFDLLSRVREVLDGSSAQ